MKKVIFFLAAFSFIAVSCTKEGFEPFGDAESRGRIKVVKDFDGSIVPMNESFQISGKAAALSYTYRAYAEPPFVNSVRTNATSVVEIDNYVFVAWHTLDQPYGGSICAYELTGGTDYVFRERVDFRDTDWHDIAAERNGATYTLYLAGQRNPDSSGYLLQEHEGAVVGKMEYKAGATTKFQIPTYEELPLPSYGANGIELTDNGKYIVVAGNGKGNAGLTNGGIYQGSIAFDNISDKKDLVDGEFIDQADFTNTATHEYAVLERSSPTEITMYAFNKVQGNDIKQFKKKSHPVAASDLERNAIAWENDTTVLMALGRNGVWSFIDVPGQQVSIQQVNALGSSAVGIDVDPVNKIVYVAAAEGGLHVLAGYGYNGGVLINDYDLIGKFIPPTNNPFPGQFDVKDVAIHNQDKLTLATGRGGVFFVDKN